MLLMYNMRSLQGKSVAQCFLAINTQTKATHQASFLSPFIFHIIIIIVIVIVPTIKLFTPAGATLKQQLHLSRLPAFFLLWLSLNIETKTLMAQNNVVILPESDHVTHLADFPLWICAEATLLCQMTFLFMKLNHYYQFLCH